MPSAPADVGAYGLRLPGLPGADRLTPAPDHWPTWSFCTRPAGSEPVGQHVGPDHARLDLQPEGYADIDRLTRTTTVHLPSAPPPEAWVHPLLGSTALLAAQWSGRLAFHGGGFLDGSGRAWGVLGHREQGKSSTLAWLTAHGHTVLTDDLLITDGRVAFAGPRCIDLRASAAARFAIGHDIGVVGTRRRFRVPLGPVPAEVPFGGMVVLDWADETSVTSVPLAERGPTLTEHRGLLVQQRHAVPWLMLLGSPVLVLRRPQEWDALDDAMEQLLEHVAGT